MAPVRVALATFAGLPDGWPDDHLLARELEARDASVEFRSWDDRSVDWDRFARVVVRSTWDYTRRRNEFLGWAEAIGDRKLHNAPQVLRWNSDKSYLADLREARIPVIATTLVRPSDPVPALDGEVVVKPTISAGARDTGRFSPRSHDPARRLLGRLRESGRTAMVQPYAAEVDTAGETAVVFFGGVESHVLRKRPVLEPDEEAPTRDDAIGTAEAMFRDDLVTSGTATGEERRLAAAVLSYLKQRFGSTPLYARVDLVPDSHGRPMLMELEAVEPNFYLATAPGSAQRLASLILADPGR